MKVPRNPVQNLLNPELDAKVTKVIQPLQMTNFRSRFLCQWVFYRPHPKDGEGNVFSLSTPGGGYPARFSRVPYQVRLGGGYQGRVPPARSSWEGGYPARFSRGEVTLPGPARGDTLPGPAGRYQGRVPPARSSWEGGYPARSSRGEVTLPGPARGDTLPGPARGVPR